MGRGGYWRLGPLALAATLVGAAPALGDPPPARRSRCRPAHAPSLTS
ncbi:MAG TPA: hypothetical protein VN694_07750 [Caulobacteraceae bacterium]|nr:hypothetical protein [Caulobacteraceae bacterium]